MRTTHVCHDCGSTWVDPDLCHCAYCHRSFPDTAAFDAHRVRGRCRIVSAAEDRLRRNPETLRRLEGIETDLDAAVELRLGED